MGGTSSKTADSKSATRASYAAAKPIVAPPPSLTVFAEKKSPAAAQKSTVLLKGEPIQNFQFKLSSSGINTVIIDGLGTENTQDDLKKRIEEETGIPVSQQNIPLFQLLFTNNEKLGDITWSKYPSTLQIKRLSATKSPTSQALMP